MKLYLFILNDKLCYVKITYMNELISIVMPVYNSSQFLENSIESVLNQTYKNIELIVVDDKSTDNSLEIIENFAKKDKRIKVLKHNNNCGLAATRNTGIENASGKYITFIDSDDEYGDLKTLETISKKFDKSIDLYIFSIIKIYKNENKPDFILEPKIQTSIVEYDKVSAFRASFENYFKHSSCNKIFILDIIKKNNLRFAEIKLGEDLPFNAHYSLHIRKVQFIEEAYYKYNIHSQSMCRTEYSNDYLSSVFKSLFENYKEFLNKNLEEKAVYSYLNIMIFTKMFASLFRHYKRSVKTVNLKLPKEYKKLCKQNLNKKDMLCNDYYFAKSYFNPLYRYTIFVFISINYYIRKLFKKNHQN